jgi:hypothetical protein
LAAGDTTVGSRSRPSVAAFLTSRSHSPMQVPAPGTVSQCVSGTLLSPE